MSDEKKKVLDKIEELLNKRHEELLQRFPYIHEIGDGIIIRFFYNWNKFEENNQIMYREIYDKDNPNDFTFLYFLPKESVMETSNKNHINCISCLDGSLKIKIDGNTLDLPSYTKKSINSNKFECTALEDTYVIISSNQSSKYV